MVSGAVRRRPRTDCDSNGGGRGGAEREGISCLQRMDS